MPKSKNVKQAVVIVHGMGEQRPLEMLNRFIHSAIPGKTKTVPGTNNPIFYSRPNHIDKSYESRIYLARKTDDYAQTEFFEYHWAHMMQGNQLSDLWITFRRILFQFPWKVPSGLRVVWGIFWALIIGVIWYLYTLELSFGDITIPAVISSAFGTGVITTIATWVITKFMPGKITSTFVDVVRYLDTSPRSYAVRKNIRKGMVELLQNLHDASRYDRIIIVAHSLGGYVAYDGITYLWTQLNQKRLKNENQKLDSDILEKLEQHADELLKNPSGNNEAFRSSQREMWKDIRTKGNPWLISDFVTLGTPMYMADQLFTKNREEFDALIDRQHLATCPPQPDLPGNNEQTLYTYHYNKAHIIYHAAPFAVVRWTNMWFPPELGFFGDWFGGPLNSHFGGGIKDIKISGNVWKRYMPALAHTYYFNFPNDDSENSVTAHLQEAMELNSQSWAKAKPKKSTSNST